VDVGHDADQRRMRGEMQVNALPGVGESDRFFRGRYFGDGGIGLRSAKLIWPVATRPLPLRFPNALDNSRSQSPMKWQ
jgi:hypothetical protein